MPDATGNAVENPQALGGVLPLSVEARTRFSQDSIDLIFASIAPTLNSRATLMRFVEIAARYDLDPFTGEIWLANMGGRNGGASNMTILVGRDGYLKVAKRDARFVACNGQPVYENDTFDAELVSEDRGWRVKHKPAHPARRGRPLGAYATLVRRGLPTLYFFASLEQFRKSGGAWQYEDAMIVKCAVSYLLRTTYGVSGPVPADEIDAGFDPARSVGAAAPAASASVDRLPERVRDLFARAAERDRLSWRLPEVLARIMGPGGEPLDAEVRKLERDLVAWLAENDVPDAVVVPDDEPVPAEGRPQGPDEVPVPAEGAPEEGEDAAETVDATPVLSPDERWRQDPDWRAHVGPILSALMDLLGDGDEEPESLLERATAEQLRGELAQAGVPAGWVPPGDEDSAPRQKKGSTDA